MKEELATIGALLSAVLVGVCCWGPLVLVGLGLTGFGLGAAFAKYRIVFMAITLALLGVAFFFSYRKREVICKDGTCEMTSGSKRAKVAFWLVMVAALASMSTHLWSSALSGNPRLLPGGQALILEVSGMHCAGCAVSVKRALESVPGVRAAGVDFDASEATVALESGHVPPEELVRAIEKLGYRARLKE